MSTPRTTIRITVAITSVVYAVILYIAGVRLDNNVKHLLSYLPSVAGLALIVFDRWLWKLPPINRLHSRPRIGGLWQVELQPDAASHIPEGGNRGPIAAYMLIEQSFWSVCVTQFTAESTSQSRAVAYIRRPDSSRQMLSFTYDNQPRREHLPRSPRHTGACELSLSTGSPTVLPGLYFTDRFTAGEMKLILIDRTTNYADFAAAAAHDRATQSVGP